MAAVEEGRTSVARVLDEWRDQGIRYVRFELPDMHGTSRSKAVRSPPTIIESLPSSRVITLPDTGASSMRAPQAIACAASARLAAGLTVLMST